jgi:hypothetical protein
MRPLLKSKKSNSHQYFNSTKQLLKSKRSAEMTIGTIIIIILALVVLIFLIYSFMKGGGSLMDTLSNFFAGGPNADTIKSSCMAACTTQQVNSFCTEVRTLKLTDKESRLGSCKTFSNPGVAGIASCPDINCGPETLPKKCKDIDSSAQWSTSSCKGTNADLTSQVGDSENNNIKVTPYCCNMSAATAKKCSGTSTKRCTDVPSGSCVAAGCVEPTVSTDIKCAGAIDCTKLTGDSKCIDSGCQLVVA